MSSHGPEALLGIGLGFRVGRSTCMGEWMVEEGKRLHMTLFVPVTNRYTVQQKHTYMLSVCKSGLSVYALTYRLSYPHNLYTSRECECVRSTALDDKMSHVTGLCSCDREFW